MLNENAYTTEELIHYAGVDDRFKPMLADRIARDGMPDPDTDDEVAGLEETIEELRATAFSTRDQDRWLDGIDEATSALDEAVEADDISEAVACIKRALESLGHTRNSIAAHSAD